jgi:hypothetical protein
LRFFFLLAQCFCNETALIVICTIVLFGLGIKLALLFGAALSLVLAKFLASSFRGVQRILLLGAA